MYDELRQFHTVLIHVTAEKSFFLDLHFFVSCPDIIINNLKDA